MSMSLSTSNSSSVPTVTETPENQIIDQLSGVAAGLANNMYQWAQGVYAQTSQITNAAVSNFFNVSQQMSGLSSNLTSQYNNLFAPENAQLIADANSYASPARMAVDMGMAGATQAQAGQSALSNSEEALRSYGIDPSSGRYAALDKAAAVQNAANVAGAQNTQRQADITTGQKLRSEAVQVGAQLPAAIANVNNTAIQANTGASNASLANANTGRNLMGLPNDYLGTAMGVKLPLQGQTSRSNSVGTSSSPSQGGGGSSSSRPSGGAPGGGGGGGPAWMPQHSGGANIPGGIFKAPNFGAGGGGSLPQDYLGTNGAAWDPSGINSGQTTANDFTGGDGSMGIGQAGLNDPTAYTTGDNGGGVANPFSDPGFGQQLPQDNSGFGGPDQNFGGVDQSAIPTDTGWGNIGYDPNANAPTQDMSGWGNYGTPSADTNWGTGADQYTGGSSDPNASYNAPIDTSSYSPPVDNSAPTDYSAPVDTSGGSNFAGGGAIPMSGHLSPALSPSGGRQVDDIRARGPGGQRLNLNANEFVIPQDVALWKGQEFFQNLIDQSRKRRVMAPAQGKPSPAQNMR